jgi:hypothetical protein
VLNPVETDFPAITELELNELCAGPYTPDIAESLISDMRLLIFTNTFSKNHLQGLKA